MATYRYLVAALKPEWTFLKRQFRFRRVSLSPPVYDIVGTHFRLLQCGFGLTAAARSFATIIQDGHCGEVIHFGTSGGLVGELVVGSLFAAEAIISDDGQAIATDAILTHSLCAEFPEVAHGKLYSARVPLKTSVQKRQVAQATGALAVDMESYAIAKLCQEAGIPYASLRGVFDAVDDDLQLLGEPFDAAGNLSALKMAFGLVCHPSLIFSLPKFQRRMTMIQNKLMAPLKRIILPMLVCGLVFLSACSKLSCQSSPSVAPTAVVKKMQRADAEIPLALLAPDGLGVRLHLTKPLFVSSPALKSLQDFLTTVLPDFDFAKIAALPVKEVIIGLESDGQKFFVIGRADANFKRTPAEVTDFAKANGLAVTTETRADLTYYYFDDDHLQTLVNLTQDFFVFGDEALILKVRDRHTQAVEAAVLPASDPAIPARFVWRRGGDYPDLRIEVTDAPTPKLIVTAMFTNPLLKTAADAAIAIFVQTHQDFGEAWQRGKDDSNFTTLRRSWELNVIPYDRLTALVSQYYEETMQLLFN